MAPSDACGCGIAVHEVGVVAVCDIAQERRFRVDVELVPAHVRDRQVRGLRQCVDPAVDDAEAACFVLGGRVKQQLHTETDAEHGLGQGGQEFSEPGPVEA